MNNYDSSITGIVIDQYPSVAEVVKIMRKYTKDAIMEIRDQLNKNEFVMSCDYIDEDELKRLIKCVNELKKSKITVKIYENNEQIDLQLLKNWLGSCRQTAIQTEAEVELEASEADESELEEFKDLWKENQSDWVVLKDDYDYTIFNIKRHSVMHIEDEELNNRVAAMMILQGNRVVDGSEEIEKVLKG
ncbi:MAG: hypothetical protein J6M92_08190 [Oribacterium sp.]|nr:hypothetical protein [Oribacterium sp.]